MTTANTTPLPDVSGETWMLMPFRGYAADRCCYLHVGGVAFGRIEHTEMPTNIARAQLASKAPKMLRALEIALAEMRIEGIAQLISTGAFDAVKDAIAEARGGTL